jgi:hypothetical protein
MPKRQRDTAKAKEYRKRYNASEKGKLTRQAWLKTDQGQAKLERERDRQRQLSPKRGAPGGRERQVREEERHVREEERHVREEERHVREEEEERHVREEERHVREEERHVENIWKGQINQIKRI